MDITRDVDPTGDAHTLQAWISALDLASAREVRSWTYQTGDSDFLTVVDNWQRWLEFDRRLHRETVDRDDAVSDLQREVGLLLRPPAPEGEETDER